ncbi:MAG: restriction endonuclease subunit S [Hydrogenophilales bacterium]|nr:restriction endonuclease subunit S [Hydrogenophilales bacterium]
MKKVWPTKTLGEVLQKTEMVNPLQSPQAEFDYIDVSSVSNATFQIEATQRLKGKEAPSRARKLVRASDILFATIRPTLQRIAIVPEYLDKQVCSTGYFVLRPQPGIDHRFVFYSLFTENFMGQMESLQKGASYPAVTDGDVKAQLIPVPPLPEQQRIVAILDQAFDGIAKARANAEKNLQNARALFESHLQSVFADAWQSDELVTLADIATDITDGDHMPPPKAPSGVPFITIGNVAKDTRTIDFADTFMVSRDYFDRLKPNKKPKKGDVLYTVTGSFGIPVLVNEHREFCFQRHIGLVRPKPEVNSEWLYFLLMSPQIIKQANEGATGTAQKTVSLKLLRGFEVPHVPLALQRATAAKLKTVSAETQRLESLYQRKLAALDALKKSLLHQAFSGAL